jgi:ABC-type multidrug transport system ATPase subunit
VTENINIFYLHPKLDFHKNPLSKQSAYFGSPGRNLPRRLPLLSTHMSKSPFIRLGEALTIGYGNPLARLSGQALELPAGTHFLLARNGRGKTTLLRTLAGTLKPVAGRFELRGRVQYLPEDLRFDAEIPASAIFRALVPRRQLANALDLARQVELEVRKDYGKLSTGNRRKVSLILAECSRNSEQPEILFLDEPFSGLDAACRQIFEERWRADDHRVLRLVSCHPDYDSMAMPSALLIESGHISHHGGPGQTWQSLKDLLN